MKITAQEEYGLRILIRLASCKDEEGLSIPQLSEAEGLTTHYAAKIARTLRMANFIRSTPGNKGGYILARPAGEVVIKEVLEALGGVLFDTSFCGAHKGNMRFCTNSVDCSARSLWQILQLTIDKLLVQITLSDLIAKEEESAVKFNTLVRQNPVL
ncbi:RrF2 family transcriptional regulator [Niabella beijingensis]|uniref:RrF2 family transcriptional regulator n=1 Tax=Niabella beijingensis TaxID=2872700 RepID=UPI001CBE0BBD|nr:Rrf2 family transcriptional regulator [Niabella beijingensis]MBZ4191164.1 Rrf2 family transcriptional regulator [Niabella beijingensis]